MSKFLDSAIKEMKNYGDMGLPDGENGGGMGSKNPVVNAYRMNNILRRRQQAEEEENHMDIDGGMRDADMPNDTIEMDREEDADHEMDMDNMAAMDNDEGLGMGDEGDTEEMKSFFQDNPTPSDDEVMQYADERGIDMEQMRQEVYALIQSLLGASDPVGDGEEDMGDDFGGEEDMGDEIDFSSPIDSGDEVPEDEYDEEEEPRMPAARDRMRKMLNTPSEQDSNRPRLHRSNQRLNRSVRSGYGLGHPSGRKLGENSQ